MDGDSAIARAERTFWNVWYYITGAVSRLLRSEPADSVNNDPNSHLESSVDANIGQTEGSPLSRAVDEDQSLLSASQLGSSRPVVTWEVCAKVADSGPNEESIQLKPTSEEKVAEEGESEREEPITQPGNYNVGTHGTKHTETSEDEQEQDKDVKVDIHGQDEMLASDETCPGVASPMLQADAIRENIGEGAGAEEQTCEAPDDHQDMDETLKNFQLKDEEHDKKQQGSEQDASVGTEIEETEVSLSTDLSLGEADQKTTEEIKVQREDAEIHKEGESVVSVFQLIPEQPNVTSSEEPGARKAESLLSFSEEIEEAKTEAYLDDLVRIEQEQTKFEGFADSEAGKPTESEDKGALDDEEEKSMAEDEAAGVSVEAVNKRTGVVPESDVNTLTEKSHSKDLTTNACLPQHFQAASTEALKTDEEPDDVEAQIETSEPGDAGVNSQSLGLCEKLYATRDPSVQDEELSSAESHVEKANVTTGTTVQPEGETGEEVNADLKDTPAGVIEGRSVTSQDPNAREESQEAVPVDNNEPRPEENTTQWFLEVADYEETQTARLPEEVETEEPESPQNSGSGSGSGAEGGSSAIECMEDEQDWRFSSTADRESILCAEADILSISAQMPTQKALVEPLIEESRGVPLVETAGLSDDFMKTVIEKEPSAHDGWTGDERHRHDDPGEMPAENESDGGSCDSKEAEASWAGAAEDVAAFTESNDVNAEEDSSGDSGLIEDAADAGFMEEAVEADPGFAEPPATETQAVEEAGLDGREMAEELPIVDVSVELEGELVSGSELSAVARAETPVTLLDTLVQLSDEDTCDNSVAAATADDSAATECKLMEETALCGYDQRFPEDMGIGGHHSPSDEEIFNMWMEAALSEQTSDSTQQQQPGQQTDARMDLINEQDDGFPQKQLVELQSEESGLDDVECSPPTAEYGLSDQPLTHHLGFDAQQSVPEGTESSHTMTETSTLVEIKQTDSGDQLLETKASVPSRSGSQGSLSSDSGPQDGSFEAETGPAELTSPDEASELDEADGEELLDDQTEVDGFALDFAAQKSRIAVKNPRVRPPKDPRSLLHKPSVEPMLSAHRPGKVPAGVPLGGLGIGIKLPGLGAGFPTLKKTPRVQKEEKEPENSTQELEVKPEGKEEDSTKAETPHKPRWTPPRHPGFGNPLMSELKTKLKKTAKE